VAPTDTLVSNNIDTTRFQIAEEVEIQDTVEIGIYRVFKDTLTLIGVGDIMLGTNYPNDSYLPSDSGKYLMDKGLARDIARPALEILYQNPKMEFDSVLRLVEYESQDEDEILSSIPSLRAIFRDIRTSEADDAEANWIMGNLRRNSLGNIPLRELRAKVEQALNTKKGAS